MIRLEVEDLKEYLSIIVDLEKNIYFQEGLMTRLRSKIFELGNPGIYVKPVRPQKIDDAIAEYKKQSKEFFHEKIALCILGLLSIVFFVLPVPTLVTVITIFLFVFYCLGMGGSCAKYKEAREKFECISKKYQEALAQYDREYEEYLNTMFQDRSRIAMENCQKKMLQENLQQLEDQNRMTAQTLSNLYALDVIYVKYRTFPQVCSLYEYICSGLCVSLEDKKGYASGGAYNVLEREQAQKTIILQLNQIINCLNAIKENQFMLYSAVQEGNRKLDAILSGIGEISSQISQIYFKMEEYKQPEYTKQLENLEKASAISTYHAERIEKEIAYMNRMNYFAGKYDAAGIFRRMPPT